MRAAALLLLGLAAAGPAAAQGLAAMQPGMWTTTITVRSVDAPGMPPAAVRAMAGRPITVSDCVTASDVRDWARRQGRDRREGRMTCSEKPPYAVAAGRLVGGQTCAGGGVTMRSTIDARFSPTRIAGTTRTATTTGATTITSVADILAVRTGACAR